MYRMDLLMAFFGFEKRQHVQKMLWVAMVSSGTAQAVYEVDVASSGLGLGQLSVICQLQSVWQMDSEWMHGFVVGWLTRPCHSR